MQDTHFLMSALQPRTDITSLALPTDSQMDRRMRDESQELRNARVQEQVRARMMQKGQSSSSQVNSSVSNYGSGESYSSRSQYTTLPSSYSSRSQILSSEQRISTARPAAYSTIGAVRSGGYSSRSAVDLGGTSQKISVATQQRGYSNASRPTSYHERVYPTRREYDTMSLRSLRIGDGDDRYEQAATSGATFYGRQMSATSAGPTLQRSYSGNIAQDGGGGSTWVERAEVAQTRTIRAPAMRTLQRFQSTNRARMASASYGTLNAASPQIQQQTSVGGGSNYVTTMLEHNSRAPSVRSLADMQDMRGMDAYDGNKSLVSQHSFTSGFDDMDMPSAVKYLMASDPNLQVLGAAFIQHRCYNDSDAKNQASLQAISKLVKLFNKPNQDVQRHATGAMRNLIYDSAENKSALVEENGVFELLQALKEPDDELKKNVSGILWNLSSSDNLKTRLARDTLAPLTERVLSPLSGSAGSALIQQNASEAEIFYNSTGFLRNLSSASEETRLKMRECPGLLDSLVCYTKNALQAGKCEDKSVENAVCVLRNLSYRIYDEMSPSNIQRLEGTQRGRNTGGDSIGCFTPQSRKLKEQQQGTDLATFAEISRDPKGMEWLWHPQIVGLYNRLLQQCELNRHTTEAAAGALQNITAGDRRWAGVLSQVALEQERILNPVLDRLRTADHSQLRSLTGLIRNLSRHAKNKDEMSTKLVSHLLEKLPRDSNEKCPPVEVIINIVAVLNNLAVAGPLAARDIVYFNGLEKLMYIKKKRDSPDNEKASRAASSLLTNMWQYSKLHRDFKAKGYRKEDFLSS